MANEFNLPLVLCVPMGFPAEPARMYLNTSYVVLDWLRTSTLVSTINGIITIFMHMVETIYILDKCSYIVIATMPE